jgi:hypothetical protein
MYIEKDLFNAIDWESIGCIKRDEQIIRDDVVIGYFYTTGREKIEFYFDSDNLKEFLSSYEIDYLRHVGGSHFERYWLNRYARLPGVGPSYFIPSPQVWEEFLTIKGSKTAKRSWMYKKTGLRGSLTEIHDGTLYPKHLTHSIVIDGVYKVVPDSYDVSDLTYYEGCYYTSSDGFYPTLNGAVPLGVIILRGQECEEHGVYISSSCPECARQYPVHGYSARAEGMLSFKDEGEANPDYMGIELEYENCSGNQGLVYRALPGHVIVKRDGSIRNGFEIVTAPATLGVHKKAFSGFYGKVKLDVLANCGMHVHVDKRKMNQMQIGKLLAFIYHRENIPHLEALAGRSFSTNSYCRAEDEKKITHNFTGRYSHKGTAYRSGDGKYQALNLSPTNTLEFRIFAPPLDEKTLFSRLELVQAMVDWTKPAVCSVKDAVSWEKFVTFVNNSKKSYINLFNTLHNIQTA